MEGRRQGRRKEEGGRREKVYRASVGVCGLQIYRCWT